jgi:hypothetical protein
MPRWIRLVALFMLAFALLDVCTPEPCEAKIVSTSSSSAARLLACQGSASGNDCCPFEEDCFNCAHYAPPTIVNLEPVAMVGFAEPSLGPTILSGAASIPYHPPRA